jgi:hypothetical protein
MAILMVEESKSHGNPDLRSFHDLKTTLPATKIGAIVALLPEIHSLQRRGHKTRAIWECLTNDGLQMSYDLFRLYLRRARRRNAQFQAQPQTAPPKVGESREIDLGDIIAEPAQAKVRDQHPIGTAAGRADPFAAIRRSRKQMGKERFDYDPLTPLKEDLLR